MKLKIIVLIIVQSIFTMGIFGETELNMDPSIYRGRLKNGVSYFIKENNKPENRVELRLVVKAGSVLETEKQKGLAHFVEHMAFNGTKNFPKDKLIKYLESLGMGFGPEINAYTSFDETVYKLSIPADNREAIENGFMILEDWAHNITLSPEEIEKERGVIIEEWRLGRGGKGRFWDKLYPTLLDGSRYAQRLPIGVMDVIKNSHPMDLREYYYNWYRPDLISVVVVGDIDTEYARDKIEEHFSYTTSSKPKREYYSVPIEDELDIELISDPEQIYSEIFYYIKRNQKTLNTLENYREYMTHILSVIMFNDRMREIYTKPGSPFLSASGGYGDIVIGTDINNFYAQAEDGEIKRALEAILVEIESVKRYGYTPQELERAKSLILMIVENYYNERENKENNQFVQDIIKFITIGNVPLDPQYDMDIVGHMIPEISLESTNRLAKESFSGLDRTLAIHTGKEDSLPTEEEVRLIFDKVSKMDIKPRAKEDESKPLFDIKVKPGEVIKDTIVPETDIHTITLSNGIEVYFKQTDFKADEVLFSGISYGGYTLIEDNEFVSGLMATSLSQLSGLNGLDSIEVDRALTGKNVSLKPWISSKLEGFSGSSSLKDMELLFQLVYLNFMKPEFNMDSFNILKKNYNEYLSNKDNYPDTIFSERVMELLGSSHFRVKPLTTEDLDRADFETVSRIYKERFGNPSDFRFILVGSMDIDRAKEFAVKYLGSLPLDSDREWVKDLGIRSPEKVVKESVKRGLEEKSTVQIVFNGEFSGSGRDSFLLSIVDSYLEEVLRLKIREELGGTYGVSLYTNVSYLPYRDYQFGIYFGCEPGRENELILESMDVVKNLLKGEVDLEVLDGIRENYIRRRELSLKENSYWLSSIRDSILYGHDLDRIDQDLSSLITRDNLVETSKSYLDLNRYVQVVLKPGRK